MAQQRPIGFWLTLVDGLINEQFNNIVEEHGVTRRQWQIMNILAENPATEEGLDEALAPFFGPEPDGSSVEHIDELIESGWVIADGGTYTLTDLGHTSLAALGEVVTRNRDHIAEDISAEEYDQTLDVLQRIARNLGWTEE